jgi:hypothetical protein
LRSAQAFYSYLQGGRQNWQLRVNMIALMQDGIHHFPAANEVLVCVFLLHFVIPGQQTAVE